MTKSEFHIPGEIAAFKLPEFEVALAHAAAKSFKNSKEAQLWARRELQGKTFTNADTGMTISIGRNAIDKFTSASASLKSSDTAAHFSAIKALPDLLHNAIEGERRSERDNVRHFKAVHRFFAALKIGGNFYRVGNFIEPQKSSPLGGGVAGGVAAWRRRFCESFFGEDGDV